MYLASDHEMLHCHQPRPLIMERMWKSRVEIAPNCPRCTSSNTKFCYYNNYSLSQPRYFCKSCRRYWTKGGSLRNVPAGGGCRKSRRTKTVRLPSHGGSSSNADDGSPGIELATGDPYLVGSSGGHDEPDIDMAAVFAKFVNCTQKADLPPDIPGSQGFNIQIEDLFGDCQTEFSTTDDGEQLFAGLGKGFPSDDHILQEGKAQEFPGRHDPNSFGLQTMLSDEFAQDPIWSDSTTMTNFSWQPTVQLQELGSFCDDQSKFSTNDCDNWSLYDLPSYDIFSKP